MPFDPSGLPNKPTCESDISRWAEELETWIVSKLAATHSEIDNIVIEPFDICTEVGNLSGPTCLVPADGVDTTAFSFAPDGDTPLTPGVLPWPGSVLNLTGRPWDVYTLNFGGTVSGWNNWTDFVINFPVPFATNQYFLVIEPLNQARCFWAVIGRLATGFTLSVINGEREGGPYENINVSFKWSAFYYAQ